MFLCIASDESIPTVPLLTVVPRVVAHGAAPGVAQSARIVWCDVRGLPVRESVERVRCVLASHGATSVCLAVSAVPIVAEVAARHTQKLVTHVREGEERQFLAPFGISVLGVEARLANLLDGAGVESCADLARLSRESVEVRFGPECVPLWRLARADDGRRIFSAIPRPLPESSLEWSDYTLRRAERLLFVINALCGSVCEELRTRGEGALGMTLRFALANRTTYEHPLRAARATASQNAWMRMIRLELDRIVLPDAVTGISLRVESAGALGGTQGDVFDRGFGTVRVAEEAVAELLDDQGGVVVEPDNDAHPLLDRRASWTSLSAARAVDRARITAMASGAAGGDTGDSQLRQPALTLQMLGKPVRISVATAARRDTELPVSYRDGRETHRIVDVAGPDRVSGGQWEVPYARDYYRCVTESGVLVWLFRDARNGAWYLHGWWD